MSSNRNMFLVVVLLAVSMCFSDISMAMTGKEIVEKAQKSQAGESFRAALEIETFHGNKRVSQHSLWVMGQVEKDNTVVFIDFSEPQDSKGVRILCHLNPAKDPEGYMYLPATEEVFQIDVKDPATDIGGTGLTMADFQPLIPEKGETETLLREEDVDGIPCYVVEISGLDSKEARLVWITKDSFDLVKLEQKGSDRKVQRAMRVVEFFTTNEGKRYPRQEEITLPAKNIKIKVRQENAVFGIVVPDELTNPATFGKFKWQI
jgi:hypothetical protein